MRHRTGRSVLGAISSLHRGFWRISGDATPDVTLFALELEDVVTIHFMEVHYLLLLLYYSVE